MEAGVGVGEVRPGRVAGVRVSARMMVGVFEDLIKETIHRAAAREILAHAWSREPLRVRQIEVPFVHDGREMNKPMLRFGVLTRNESTETEQL